ncbi:MAG: DUF1571 domain-containing protein [Aureliella sp.]
MSRRGILAVVVILGAAVAYLVFRQPPETPSSLGGAVSTTVPVIVDSPAEDDPTVDAETGAHALDPLLEMARELLVSFNANVRDYSATMVKRERIAGVLGAESKIELKIRCRDSEKDPPVSLAVYMQFLEPRSSAGREVIWGEDLHEGKIVTHEGGFKNWKTLHLDPDGMLAMLGNKYSITQVGLRRLIEKLVEKGTEDREVGPCVVNTITGQHVGDRACTLYQIVHPEKDERFDFHIAQIFVDDELSIPLRYAAYLWPDSEGGDPPLEEEYTYLNVKLNIGLTDKDFDPENEEYKYP